MGSRRDKLKANKVFVHFAPDMTRRILVARAPNGRSVVLADDVAYEAINLAEAIRYADLERRLVEFRRIWPPRSER